MPMIDRSDRPAGAVPNRQPTGIPERQVSHKTLNLSGRLLDLSTPVVMGILNVTPDSFYDGSRLQPHSDEILQKAGQMLADGATILDVGGYSTRPGAAEISEYEETERVLPVIQEIMSYFPETIISIDTFRTGVARKAVEAGAVIINDVSGGNLDEKMFETVAKLGVPYILMHMRGTPQTMNQMNNYADLIQNILCELAVKLNRLRTMGVADVVVDPGFGFAKNVAQNFELLNGLEHFGVLNAPLLVGVSRKSMIGRTLEITPAEALNGTTVLNTLALQKGAEVLRVHDVKEAAETVKLWQTTSRGS